MEKSIFKIIFSNEQLETFVEAFYGFCSFDDSEGDCLYGCPWDWEDGVTFFEESQGQWSTPEELAKLWYKYLRETDEDFRGWDDGTKPLDGGEE